VVPSSWQLDDLCARMVLAVPVPIVGHPVCWRPVLPRVADRQVVECPERGWWFEVETQRCPPVLTRWASGGWVSGPLPPHGWPG